MLNGHFIYCSLSFLLFVLASAYAWQNNRSGFIPLIFQHELVLLFCILQDLFMARTNRPSDITCPCNENSTTEECSVLLLSALEYSIILSKKMMIIIYYCCCISTNNCEGLLPRSTHSLTQTTTTWKLLRTQIEYYLEIKCVWLECRGGDWSWLAVVNNGQCLCTLVDHCNAYDNVNVIQTKVMPP